MKKLLSILGMTNFIVIGTSLIISCGDKLTKPIEQPQPIEQPKIDISSIVSIESPKKLIVKNPEKVTLQEIYKCLYDLFFKKIKEINNSLTSKDYTPFILDGIDITTNSNPFLDLSNEKLRIKVKLIGNNNTFGETKQLIIELPIATTT